MPMNTGTIVLEQVCDDDRDSLPNLSVCYGHKINTVLEK